MGELPDGWVRTSLTRTISLDGLISDGDWIETKDQDPNGSIRLIQLADIGDGFFKDKSSRFMTEIKAENLRCTFLKKGDILIARMPDPLGRACIFSGVKQQSVTVVDICIVRTLDSSAVINKLVMYWINSPEIRNLIQMQATGTTRKRITRKKLEVLDLPLPPLNEQIRIANKLDTLLAKVEAAQTRLEKIPTLLKRFRQSVLAAATSGELTREWRNDNPKISRINPDNFVNTRLGCIETQEVYFEAPINWGWVRFGSQVKLINGDRGKNYPNKSEYVENGLPFINTGHIDPNGTLSKKRMNYISREKFNSLGGGKIKRDDLVYCLRGATMGKTATVNPLYEGAIASSLVIVRPNDSIIKEFVYFFLISPQGKNLILKFDNGSAQPNLSAKSLAMYPLALPPIEEQKEIVRRVEALFALADSVEKQYQQAFSRLKPLLVY